MMPSAPGPANLRASAQERKVGAESITMPVRPPKINSVNKPAIGMNLGQPKRAGHQHDRHEDQSSATT